MKKCKHRKHSYDLGTSSFIWKNVYKEKSLKKHIHKPYVYKIDGKGEHYKCRRCDKIIKQGWIILKEKFTW